jgi:hypothetical protein
MFAVHTFASVFLFFAGDFPFPLNPAQCKGLNLLNVELAKEATQLRSSTNPNIL